MRRHLSVFFESSFSGNIAMIANIILLTNYVFYNLITYAT